MVKNSKTKKQQRSLKTALREAGQNDLIELALTDKKITRKLLQKLYNNNIIEALMEESESVASQPLANTIVVASKKRHEQYQLMRNVLLCAMNNGVPAKIYAPYLSSTHLQTVASIVKITPLTLTVTVKSQQKAITFRARKHGYSVRDMSLVVGTCSLQKLELFRVFLMCMRRKHNAPPRELIKFIWRAFISE